MLRRGTCVSEGRRLTAQYVHRTEAIEMMWNTMGAQGGDSPALQEAVAAPSGEGRWPRICERRRASVTLVVRCNHVL